MTILTLHIPDELSAQADKFGLLNEQSILQAFREFLEKSPKSESLAERKGWLNLWRTILTND